MKHLILLRHAKSSWKDTGLDDFDRPLNRRGERDAPVMGERLRARGQRPSLIVTSTANRAQRTARLIAQAIGYPVEFIQHERELYLADPERILGIVSRQDDGFASMILCAHNPGITDLTNALTDSRIDNVPTCGIAAIAADVDSWSELGAAACRLEFFDYPKRVAAEAPPGSA